MKPSERREAAKYRDRYSLGRNKALDGLCVLFEKQLALVSAEPSPDKRHTMALALASLLAEYEATYRSLGRSMRVVDDEMLGFRTDLILEEMISEVARAVGREGDGTFFVEMNEAMAACAADDGEAD